MKTLENKTSRANSNVMSKLTITFVVAVACILVVSLIAGFIYRERKVQIEATEYRLCATSDRDAAIVHNLFDDYIDTLRALSVYIKNSDDLTSVETIGLLRKMAERITPNTNLLYLPNGFVVTVIL